jgi:gentisate 1,2-dioxygenase
VSWSTGDLFVLPATARAVNHHCSAGGDDTEDAALYWVTDEPLLRYLGVSPSEKKFEMTLFKREKMLEFVETLKHEEGATHKNRLGTD